MGKTTTTANVGACLSQQGYKVLLIDLDAQANLTEYYLSQRPERTVYNAFIEESPLPITEIRENLSIVPSSLEMLDIESKTADNLERAELLDILIEPVKDKYDFILIDCPPSLGIVTINALIAATDLYITLTAETMPVKGLKTISDIISRVQRRKNPSLKLSGIIICRWGGRSLNKQVEESLRAKFGEVVFNTKIRENISLAEAPAFLEDIVTYAPTSHGAEDYKALTGEIIERTK
ncbi:MAG: ParA family protein [Aeriscardovia sp.]|nr:ParA family protein [Aeriscardovia sp.]